MRAATLSLVLGAAALAAGSPARAQGRSSAFPSAAQLVTIDAVVVDRDGRPVRGLTRDDFELLENGERQLVTHFEAVAETGAPSEPGAAAAAKRSLVIVYDDVHITPLRADAARAAVHAFLRRELRSGEGVAIVVVGSGGSWTAEIPGGREDLLAFLDSQAGGRSERNADGLTDAEAQRIVEYDDAATRESLVDRWVRQGRCQDLCEFTSPCDPREGRRACSEEVRSEALRRNDSARNGVRRTLATISRALAGLAPERGRKSLLLVSEGFLLDPAVPAYRDVVQAALRANAAIHFLDARGLSATSPMDDVGRRGDFDGAGRLASEESQLAAAGAEQVAEDSGGLAIRGNDLAGGLARAAREAEAYYLVGYEPALRPGRPGFRRLTLRVARPGLEVRARKGWFADESGRVLAATAAEPAAQARPADRREPLSPSLVARTDLRLQAATYVGPPADRERTKVRLVAEIDLASLDPGGGKGERSLELRGDVWPRDGAQWVSLDRRLKLEARPGAAAAWHALTWDVALAPGVYQVRLQLRDPAAGSAGTLTHRFEVPKAAGLRFATPIVTDALRRDAGGAPSLVAGASRRFPTGPGRSLYVQLELLGALPRRPGGRGVSARVLLRDESGREVRSVPAAAVAPDAGGRLVRAVGFGLDDLAPGRYGLRLEGRDERTGETCAHEEPLELRAAAR